MAIEAASRRIVPSPRCIGKREAMNRKIRIQLLPLGKTLTVSRGTPLREVLFAQGVEFPCGGRGRCKGCRVKVLEGALPTTADEERLLTHGEIADGWRLACRGQANGDGQRE